MMFNRRADGYREVRVIAILCTLALGCGSGCENRHAESKAQCKLTQIAVLLEEWEKRHSRLPPTSVGSLRVLGEFIPNPNGIDLFLLEDPLEASIRVSSSKRW